MERLLSLSLKLRISLQIYHTIYLSLCSFLNYQHDCLFLDFRAFHHLLIFLWLLQQGPTLTMRIHSYSLMSDVAASQQRPRAPPNLWKTSPLIVMNSFQGSEGLKLAATMFQNLFPAINVQSARLSSCLVSYFPSVYVFQLLYLSLSVCLRIPLF